jgi:4-amino-4-deoxy-L-arabinose transferase-like glycosyltransferase
MSEGIGPRGRSRWLWPEPGQRLSFILALALLACCFWLRAQRLGKVGTVADEGVFIALAEQMTRGKVLYRDLFHNINPGLTLTLAGLFQLTGPDILYPRLLAALVSTLTCLAVLVIGWRSFGSLIGLLAAFFFAIDPLNLFWSKFTFTEPFYHLFDTLGVLFLVEALRRPKPLLAVASGLAIGCAFIFKQTGIVVMAAVVALFLWNISISPVRRDEATANLRFLLLMGSGIALVCLALLVGYLWPNGALHDFLVAIYAPNVPSLTDLSQKLLTLGACALRRPIMILALAVIPLIFLSGLLVSGGPAPEAQRRVKVVIARFLLLWGLAEYGMLLLVPYLTCGFGGFSHYMVPLTAPTALMAALFLGDFVRRARLGLQTLGHTLPGSRTLILRSVGPGILVCIVAALTFPAFATDFDRGFNSLYPFSSFQQEAAIGEYVQRVTAPADHILVFTNAIFFHWAHRDPSSRFLFYSGRLAQGPLRNDVSYELAQAIQDRQTKLILVSAPNLYDPHLAPLDDIVKALYTNIGQLPYSYQDQVIFLKRRVEKSDGYVPPLPTLFVKPEDLPIAHPLRASLGDKVTFLGYNKEMVEASADAHFSITLFWRCEAAMDRDYTIFVHLVDPGGKRVAQADHQVFSGLYPTSAWRPGEVIQDRFWLRIPSDLPAGEYLLRIGMYDLNTLQRLPIEGEAGSEDALTLPGFVVERGGT